MYQLYQRCKKLKVLHMNRNEMWTDLDIANICAIKSLEELHISLDQYANRGKFVDRVIKLKNLKSL